VVLAYVGSATGGGGVGVGGGSGVAYGVANWTLGSGVGVSTTLRAGLSVGGGGNVVGSVQSVAVVVQRQASE
jgi:hypothetical protein